MSFVYFSIKYLIFLASPHPEEYISKLQVSEVAQSCPTLCDPIDYSLPGSSVLPSHAGPLFSKSCTVSGVHGKPHTRLFTQPLSLNESPPSMEFSRQEYWSGVGCHFLLHLPNPGIEPRSSALQADSLPAMQETWVRSPNLPVPGG